MYVIHAVSDKGISYPALYGLLKDKSTQSYSALFKHMSKLVPDGPDHVIVDLEQAPISLYTKYWPGTVVEGCLFHFKKALRTQLSLKGCLTFYNNSINLQSTIERYKSLAFVPAEEIQEVYEEVVEPLFSKYTNDDDDDDDKYDCPESIKSYLMYLKNVHRDVQQKRQKEGP